MSRAKPLTDEERATIVELAVQTAMEAGQPPGLDARVPRSCETIIRYEATIEADRKRIAKLEKEIKQVCDDYQDLGARMGDDPDVAAERDTLRAEVAEAVGLVWDVDLTATVADIPGHGKVNCPSIHGELLVRWRAFLDKHGDS